MKATVIVFDPESKLSDTPDLLEALSSTVEILCSSPDCKKPHLLIRNGASVTQEELNEGGAGMVKAWTFNDASAAELWARLLRASAPESVSVVYVPHSTHS